MKFVADENFDNRILRGLHRRLPTLDIVRVQDLEIAGASDPIVRAWAAQEGRILPTHDQRTIPGYAFNRLSVGETIAGVIVVKNTSPIRTVIEDMLLIVECRTASEWINQVQRLAF